VHRREGGPSRSFFEEISEKTPFAFHRLPRLSSDTSFFKITDPYMICPPGAPYPYIRSIMKKFCYLSPFTCLNTFPLTLRPVRTPATAPRFFPFEGIFFTPLVPFKLPLFVILLSSTSIMSLSKRGTISVPEDETSNPSFPRSSPVRNPRL